MSSKINGKNKQIEEDHVFNISSGAGPHGNPIVILTAPPSSEVTMDPEGAREMAIALFSAAESAITEVAIIQLLLKRGELSGNVMEGVEQMRTFRAQIGKPRGGLC